MRILSATAALLALLLGSCAPDSTVSNRAPPVARPALWKLADADTTIWLFGTIHVLPKAYAWRGPAIDDALAASDTLVVETVIDAKAGLAPLIARIGTAPGLPPIGERVPTAKRAALDAMIARSGLPPGFLSTMKTWSAALALVGVTLRDLGLDSGEGVENALEATARAAGKPVEGLETPAEQLGYFDGLSEQAQRAFLETLLDDPSQARGDYDDMLAAWARGDGPAIARTFDKDLETSPELREALLRRRNARWTEWLAHRLDRPGAVFVAVGAGHLIGRDSVLEMLGKRGLTVTRVQ